MTVSATEAYVYARKPPKYVKRHPNILIPFAPYGICYAHGEDCPLNKPCFDDLRGWAKICKRIHIWDYCTNFSHYLQPHANLYWMSQVVKSYRRYGVTGITEQGNYQSTGGEFAELHAQLFSKLFWNFIGIAR